jgi:hypothetical protein
MPTLHIQHSVPNFDGWKRAFDNDPMDRKGSGVRRYDVRRSVEDPNFVMIDLEFDTTEVAEAFLRKMQGIWSGPGKAVMLNPSGRVAELVEAREL